jgi:hypothetical protein
MGNSVFSVEKEGSGGLVVAPREFALLSKVAQAVEDVVLRSVNCVGTNHTDELTTQTWVFENSVYRAVVSMGLQHLLVGRD